MELYLVDGNFVKQEALDKYTSVIWTERYNAAGDITLVWEAGGPLDNLVTEGSFIHTPDSREIMLIETVATDKGEKTATGLSLVGFLGNRIFRNTWQTTTDTWTLYGAPGDSAMNAVKDMCMPLGKMDNNLVLPGTNGHNEVIPNLSAGPGYTGASVTIAVPYGDLYSAVKAICDTDNLGFSMYPPNIMDGTGAIIFTVYKGLDRTSAQTANPVVIFEPALDNLTDINEVRSIAAYKNVAYAWANGMTDQANIGVAYAAGASGLLGFQRRTLMVDASDVNAADYSVTDLKAILNKRAADALVNNNYIRMTDGTIVPQKNFAYGSDYMLGDVIELRNNTDTPQYARILEYIRSQDVNGEVAYPTLSVDQQLE